LTDAPGRVITKQLNELNIQVLNDEDE